ncbi:MAG: glycine--tRNA ligase subunit beta [Spirochaetota bacterium]|nr:MAG: glycine--tRNA ligase subunit beta [Spirochaetota bacterium]
MADTRDLLVEIGVEELPHAIVKDAIIGFRELFLSKLDEEKIRYTKVREFSTPRRLALLIREVAEWQVTFTEELRGPSVEKAFDKNKKPTKALLGFLKGNDIKLDDIVIKESGASEYVYCIREIGGKRSIELLPGILDSTLKAMSFPKAMRWEDSGFSFTRPIRWILFLFGTETIPFAIADVESDNYTLGHRIYSKDKIILNNPSDYEKILKSAAVIADREKRKSIIENQIEKIAQPHGLEVPCIAYSLFEENTDLTEFPIAVLCAFDESFLNLPPEVLESEMIEHQHYFPLVKKQDQSISNYFIVVSNIKNNSKTVSGYERVLLARLDDGRFFFEEDKKREFESYLEALNTVTFHEKLGSMRDKVERTKKIGTLLAELLAVDSKTSKNITEVCRLCKNDLVTLMVNEFPNLQGIMGYYYSLASGYPSEIAIGIKEHYLPRFAQDELPTETEGAFVGIADRLDTIFGIFSIGLKPKGSKDPFALRRKVLAIIRIIISFNLNFSMKLLIKRLSTSYVEEDKAPSFIDDIEEFFKARIKTIFADMGFSYDEIDASLEGVMEDIFEGYKRVRALHELRKSEGFEDLLISFKRMSNIVKDESEFTFNEKGLKESEEKELYSYFTQKRWDILNHIEKKNYEEVYRILSTFKPFVDNFFDKILVMDDDLALRANRIGLLKTIITVFSGIIDFSKIVSKSE